MGWLLSSSSILFLLKKGSVYLFAFHAFSFIAGGIQQFSNKYCIFTGNADVFGERIIKLF